MRSLVLVLVLLLCMSSAPVFGGDAIPNTATEQAADNGIPNLVTEDTDTNGRAVHLDQKGDENAEDLTPVERRVITRDTIRSNAQSVLGN